MDEKAIQQFPVLRSAYGGLTKSERRIADYIVAAPEEIMEQTISDIANATESSEITVSRFCKKLGFSGLQELKLNLIAGMSAAENKEFHDIRSGDRCSVVASKMFQNISDGLQDTLALLDYDAVDDAARILRRARRVAVYGFGNSATVCRDIATRYLRLGLAIQAYADSHMQVTSAALLSPDDAVIAVSHSGASQELLQSVQAAKDSGASSSLRVMPNRRWQSWPTCACAVWAAKSATLPKPARRASFTWLSATSCTRVSPWPTPSCFRTTCRKCGGKLRKREYKAYRFVVLYAKKVYNLPKK